MKIQSTVLCTLALVFAANVFGQSPPHTAAGPIANEAEWIWSPAHRKDAVPTGECYFRKAFNSGAVQRAEIQIAADNAYELHVNGQLIGKGGDWRAMDVYNVTQHLRAGKNAVSVRVANTDAGAAGLVARVLVQHADGTYKSHSSDATWRTSVKQFANWTVPTFRDLEWLPAKSYGALGEVLPWGNEVVIAELQQRFRVANEQFTVEKILGEAEAGSLIAMCFDARGNILASREGGPLQLLIDTNRDGQHDRVTIFCDRIKNVQGILPVGRTMLAVGEGPQGGGLYALTDQDNNGQAEGVRQILKFNGSTGEHGGHAIRLGRDGFIYVTIGNFAQVPTNAAGPTPGFASNGQQPTADNLRFAEGDLVRSRYEDPKGHAVDVKFPGATIIRTNMAGSDVKVVATGLRNAYDFAFLPDGEIITYDADMEWDISAPWYRPTRILHATQGAEFGWRSGWAKWPEYFLDNLPATINMGGGSPTGVEVYDHFAYPAKYRGAVFAADWARGRINAVFLTPSGASYSATSEVFVQGTPLNVTDLAVGPDGSLFFCTGGRGTEGGLYRIRYTGILPPSQQQLGRGIERALNHPQLDAVWAQGQIAAVKGQATNWGDQLKRIALSPQRSAKHRVRALDLLQLYGPRPDAAVLLPLSSDANPQVQVRAIQLLGAVYQQHAAGEAVAQRLQQRLGDADARVRRAASEAIERGSIAVSAESLVSLLDDEDRFVRFAARRALMNLPLVSWREVVLQSSATKVFLEGSTAVLAARGNEQDATAVLSRIVEMLDGDVNDPKYDQGYISDPDFLNVLRVAQLALIRLQPDGNSGSNTTVNDLRSGGVLKDLRTALLREYPSTNAQMNRELVRLLVHLQVGEAAPRFVAQLKDDQVPPVERLHLAAYAARLNKGWTTQHKIALIEYYDTARTFEGGHSISAYVENFARDFFAAFTLDEKRQVIRAGVDWPSSALSILAKLPAQVPAQVLQELQTLDQQLVDKPEDKYARLRVGIAAVLARSNDTASHAYLRQVYQREPDRRPVVAMALTQSPGGKNWAILVDALKTAEGPVAAEILAALAKVDRQPTDATPFRGVILLMQRSDKNAAIRASQLLAQWTDNAVAATANPQSAIQWYAQQFPNAPTASLPQGAGRSKWSYQELVSFLESPAGKSGDIRHGAQVFRSAQCVNCHRFNGVGEGIGPDLTTIANRFQTKEIVEAIVHPSQVISDQYASKLVEVNGRTLVGLVVPDGPTAITVLTSDGRKQRLRRTDVEGIHPSKVSVMPEDLLNGLTLQQVADLFAYMRSGAEQGRAARGNAAGALR